MRSICIVIFLSFFIGQLKAQDTLRLTLDEAVALARQQSPQAVAARHQYRASYWSWRSFKADYLPSLTFSSDSRLNRSISPVTMPDGSDNFVQRNQWLNNGMLTVNQNIAPLGGSLYVQSGLQRLDIFSDNQVSYQSTPVVVGYSQNLFGYNYLKWNKRIEPTRYSYARKLYAETLELVASSAAMRFFQLATAQSNWQSADYNYANADTLYQYAQGRYEIGTITENEMLQLEINFLTEQTNRLNARIEMDDRILNLRSFLGITSNVEIVAVIRPEVPEFAVPVDKALQLAHQNSPDIELFQLQKLQSEGWELRFSNMEEVYAEYTRSENYLLTLLSIMTVVAILIAVFGIYSMVTLACNQRRKEIAIRKVNGAKVREIFMLFFWQYFMVTVVSCIVAFPIGVYIMQRWLEQYTRRVSMEGWLFVGIFILVVLIVLASIFSRVNRAAKENPADVLKSE